MMTLELLAVKPASYALLAVDIPADVDFSDLADEPSDAEYDAMAAESAAMDRLDAGLLPW